jgi:ribulose kinase
VLGDCATSTGAAMLAGVAAGAFADLETAVEACVELDPAPVVPDARTAAVYAESYAAYRSLFDAVQTWTPRPEATA